MSPEKESDRDPELLYVDEVDEDDKNFIMSWAFGGTSDLEKFREAKDKLVERLSAGKALGSLA
jgi:hypothetical protein